MKKDVTLVSMEELSPIISGILEAGKDAVIKVTGNSMLPLWRDRHNNVVLTACDPEKLKKGDIPLYKRDNGQYVLHRIVRVNDTTFDLLGDAQWRKEFGLPKQNVIALTKGYYTEKGKYVSCDSRRHKLYSAFWALLLPFRRIILALYRRTVLKIKLHNDRKQKNEG